MIAFLPPRPLEPLRDQSADAPPFPQHRRSDPPARPEARPARARVDALLELLSDDSPAVLAAVRARLEDLGRAARPALRRAEKSPNARLRVRARRLRVAIERARSRRRLFAYALRPAFDLERGLYLLARLDRARFDARPYKRALDAMGAEVARRVALEADDLARPMVLTQYLGNELGFIGSEADFDHPDNIHLHRAIERRRGMPLTLCAIYLLVGRRAGLRVAPIALPGRVLLRLYAGPRSLIIDPFAGGRAKTRADCIRYLAQHGLVPRPQWFRDASDAGLFQRHLLNWMNSCRVRGLAREARELHALAIAMNRVHAGASRS